MIKDGKSTVLLRNYQPAEYLVELLAAGLPVEV